MPETTIDRLRWHFRHYAWLYRATVIALALVVSIFLAASLVENHRAEDAEIIRSWPQVDALIVRSDLHETNTSDDTSFSTRLGLSARFRYELGNQLFETDHTASWPRSDHRDWSHILREGRKLEIRVSPSNPTLISLIDHTGVP